ncbi:MAG: hybrid sensor histidine kinase/response regulator [Bacteroidia bacterium]
MEKIKILVIEDEKALRNNISEMLELSDFLVEVAVNGQDGLKKVYDCEPDLILCDVMMPEMDGFEVLFNLRQSLNNHVPFIFLTARVDRDDTRKGMNLGADDYLTKPFSRAELLNAINSRLDLRKKIGHNHPTDIGIRNIVRVLGQQDANSQLTGIIGFGEFLKNHPDSVDVETIQQMGTYIKEAGEKIYRMSKKLNLYSNLLNDTFKISDLVSESELDAYDLPKLIENTAVKIAEDFNRKWDVQLDISPVSCILDRFLIQFIVAELVDNAFRYSIKSSPVFLHAEMVEQQLVISISDEGFVSNEEQVEKIKQIKAFSKTNPYDENLGLGLYLCSNILEIVGGNIEFTHHSPKGLHVKVSFPSNNINQ